MPVVDVGVRTGDHKLLKSLAETNGRRIQEQAAILIEEALRERPACPPHDYAYQYGASVVVVVDGHQSEVMRERYFCRRCLHIEDRDNPPLAMPA